MSCLIMQFYACTKVHSHKIYIHHLGTPLQFQIVLMDFTVVSKEPPLRLRTMFHNNVVMLQKDKW